MGEHVPILVLFSQYPMPYHLYLANIFQGQIESELIYSLQGMKLHIQ